MNQASLYGSLEWSVPSGKGLRKSGSLFKLSWSNPVGMLWTWLQTLIEESQRAVSLPRMALAVWQQRRALTAGHVAARAAMVCQLQASHLGRMHCAGNPVGNVCMNVFAGELLHAVAQWLCLCFLAREELAGLEYDTAFDIPRRTFQPYMYHIM